MSEVRDGRKEGRKKGREEGRMDGRKRQRRVVRAVLGAGAGRAVVDAGSPSSRVSLPITSSMDVYSHMAVTRRPMELCVLSNHVI
jgi:hypothetical protein